MALLETAVENLNQALQLLVDRADKALDEDWKQAVNDAHELLDRLNGAKLQVEFVIPPRK